MFSMEDNPEAWLEEEIEPVKLDSMKLYNQAGATLAD